jgi:DnaJ family protein C protein 28
VDPIEKIIQEALERGDFDNLPGTGKPLDLNENPWVPPDWQMAYRMLASSGFAPEVVEEDKALRARIADLEQTLERFAQRWNALPVAQRSAQLPARERFLREYMEEIREINNRIHTYNAMAPRAMNRGTLVPATMQQAAESRLPVD